MGESSGNRALRRGCPIAFCPAPTLASAFAVLCAACGGTTGREGLPAAPGTSPPDATLVDSGASDASSGADAGLDADLQYASDARLIGIVDAATMVVVDGGGGVVWPVCAQDTVTKPDGGKKLIEIPVDSGSCAAFMWTPTYDAGLGQKSCGGHQCQSCDECVRFSECGVYPAPGSSGIFPPCSNVLEAGTASQGPGAGLLLFNLCQALFDCVSGTSCTGAVTDPSASVANCYCGSNSGAACLMDGGANGVCKTQIEAAYQAGPSTTASDILSNFTDLMNGPPAVTGVMGLYQCALTGACTMCFSSATADGG